MRKKCIYRLHQEVDKNFRAKNQKLPPSLIQSRSSVLYVILLSYINIAEGGVGGFVVLHHTVNSYLLSW